MRPFAQTDSYVGLVLMKRKKDELLCKKINKNWVLLVGLTSFLRFTYEHLTSDTEIKDNLFSSLNSNI